MNRFNLDDYAPVEERISLFYGDHVSGRILTTLEKLEPPLVVFRAEVYRDSDDTRPWATGYAYEKEGEGMVNKTSYIENCETSAIGRALANAGYHGKRANAPRPSREEMEKVERMGGHLEAPNGRALPHAPSPASGGFSLNDLVPVGKHKGKRWSDLVELQPDYVDWAVQNMSRLGADGRAVLGDALKARESTTSMRPMVRPGTPLSEHGDDLPY